MKDVAGSLIFDSIIISIVQNSNLNNLAEKQDVRIETNSNDGKKEHR